MSSFLQHVRYASRQLHKHPGFTAVFTSRDTQLLQNTLWRKPTGFADVVGWAYAKC
jgi:hypothetical protein